MISLFYNNLDSVVFMDTARVEFVQVLKAGFNNWGSRGSGGAPELMNYSASALLFRADHEPPRQHQTAPSSAVHGRERRLGQMCWKGEGWKSWYRCGTIFHNVRAFTSFLFKVKVINLYLKIQYCTKVLGEIPIIPVLTCVHNSHHSHHPFGKRLPLLNLSKP